MALKQKSSTNAEEQMQWDEPDELPGLVTFGAQSYPTYALSKLYEIV